MASVFFIAKILIFMIFYAAQWVSRWQRYHREAPRFVLALLSGFKSLDHGMEGFQFNTARAAELVGRQFSQIFIAHVYNHEDA